MFVVILQGFSCKSETDFSARSRTLLGFFDRNVNRSSSETKSPCLKLNLGFRVEIKIKGLTGSL